MLKKERQMFWCNLLQQGLWEKCFELLKKKKKIEHSRKFRRSSNSSTEVIEKCQWNVYCEGLSVQEVCSSGKEREDNKEGRESGKPKGGHEGIRDPLSLALLSLLTALLCMGSSKLFQLLLNELFTFKHLHSTLCTTPNHARHVLEFMLKKYKTDFRLHFRHFELNPPPQAQKVNYVCGAVLEIKLE